MSDSSISNSSANFGLISAMIVSLVFMIVISYELLFLMINVELVPPNPKELLRKVSK